MKNAKEEGLRIVQVEYMMTLSRLEPLWASMQDGSSQIGMLLKVKNLSINQVFTGTYVFYHPFLLDKNLSKSK